MAQRGSATPAQGMRRELKIIDAAAFSVGLIGPVGAMALLGVGAAGLLGSGATWAFIFAAVGVGLVAYGFIKLSQHIAHAGSVYALVGLTLGPRAGFVAGWALLGAYVTIGTGSMIEIGLFFGKFLNGIGLIGSIDWIVAAIGALILVTVLSLARIRVITKVLLGTELVGVVLVTILSVVIIVRLALGHGPAGQTLNTGFLQLPHGTSVSVIASAAVFGFLAFAGFEGAAALGEETLNPKRQIPRAIKTAVVVVGAFYLLTIIGQSLGFGTSPAEVKAFQAAPTPYADLATAYVGSALAALLNLAASISLLAIALGTINAAARILYALARDAGGGPVTRLSRRGEPTGALAFIIVTTLCIMVGQRLVGTTVVNATFYWLTIGTIALLVAYALATLGALRFLFFNGPRKAPAWQVVVPIAGVAFVGYTIYKNVVGVASPYNVFPYLVAAWLAIGLVLVAAVPGIAGRVRSRLAASVEGTAGSEPELASGGLP